MSGEPGQARGGRCPGWVSVPWVISAQGYGPEHVLLAVPAGSEGACRASCVSLVELVELVEFPALAAGGRSWVRGDGPQPDLGADGVDVTWDIEDFPGHRRSCTREPVGDRLERIQPDTSLLTW